MWNTYSIKLTGMGPAKLYVRVKKSKLWDTSVALIHPPRAHALLAFNFIFTFAFCIFHRTHPSFTIYWKGL